MAAPFLRAKDFTQWRAIYKTSDFAPKPPFTAICNLLIAACIEI
jgi:hypothetical protein